MRAGWTLLGLAAIGLVGCVKSGPPAVDTVAPSLTLKAFNRQGNPVFRSSEGSQPPWDACAEFSSFPARFLLAVSDAGGVASAAVGTFLGHIEPTSVVVSPGVPESTWAISRPDSLNDELRVRLAAPGPGLVRTGVLIEFQVSPVDGRPMVVLAGASDLRGNGGSLYQVTLYPAGNPVRCRGE